MIKTYSDLQRFSSFDDRFEYLKLDGRVGTSTFGFDRYINQRFYSSREWQMARNHVIFRDNGCDLGISGHEIYREILIHHINPMVVEDIVHGESWIFDPEFLITTRKTTHNALHYGADNPYPKVVASRTPEDTKLWKSRKG